jgi:phosphoserine phosphatase
LVENRSSEGGKGFLVCHKQISTSGLAGNLSSHLSLHESAYSKRSKLFELVVFDADGTLTGVTSIWQYLHERLGTWNQGRSTALRYWRGDITYDEWARLDAMMWRGKKVAEIADIIKRISYVDGVDETFNTLRKKGIKIAVASAGLSFLVNRIVRELGADFAVANELVVKDGRLTGDIRIKVTLSNKCEVIRQIAGNFHIDMKACAVIGDYSYDIPDDAGLKVAFNPKDNKLEKLADIVLTSNNLRDVLKHLV